MVVSQPPSSGPSAADAPATAPHTPNAIPRARPVKVPDTIDRVDGEVIAAPRPCTVRAAISVPMPRAAPASTEPSTNTATPAMKMRFRPTWSPTRPQVMISAAKTSE